MVTVPSFFLKKKGRSKKEEGRREKGNNKYLCFI